jgi:hypothetical protein
VLEICKHGSVRGVKLFYKAEYCGTPQSKERRYGEYKVCLNNRALRLLDHTIAMCFLAFFAYERSDFNSAISLFDNNMMNKPFMIYNPLFCRQSV